MLHLLLPPHRQGIVLTYGADARLYKEGIAPGPVPFAIHNLDTEIAARLELELCLGEQRLALGVNTPAVRTFSPVNVLMWVF